MSIKAKQDRLIQIFRETKREYGDENIILGIPNFLSKSFVSYCSMREDMLLIQSFLEVLENVDENIGSAITYSIISLYGKCFTDASNTRAPKLEPNQIFMKGSELLSTHEYIMNLRHNFIAHRGDTEAEVEFAYLLIPKGEGGTQIRYAGLKLLKFDKAQISRIKKLIDFLLKQIMTRIEKSGQKMNKSFYENFTKEQMAKMLINNLKDSD